MAVNKVVYGTNVLVDLTGDTVSPTTLFSGVTARNKKNEKITGTLFANFPDTVSITKLTNVSTGTSKKEKNRVLFGIKELINIGDVTVTEDKLLWGYRCHKKDGTIIYGTFLKNYPATIQFDNPAAGTNITVTVPARMLDSSGNEILDSSGNSIQTSGSDETTTVPASPYITYTKSESNGYIIYTKQTT